MSDSYGNAPHTAPGTAALLPAMNRYAELLSAYAQPGENLLAAAPRMTPADREEATLLAELLEPHLAPGITAARAA